MSIESLSSEDNAKLRRTIEEGVKIKQQIKDLNEGISDTIKVVAEDLGLSAKVIKDAITAQFKSSIEEMKEHVNDVEHLLNCISKK